MSSNSKEKQKEYDKNRSGNSSSWWWGIVYPDSAPENWRQGLKDEMLDGFISPLHDKDVDGDGNLKKPHYHLMTHFSHAISRKRAAEYFKRWGAVVQEQKPKAGEKEEFMVTHPMNAARYLCHLDSPDKALYEIADVEDLGSLSYPEWIVDQKDKEYSMLDKVFEIMDECLLTSYPQVVRRVKTLYPELKKVVYSKDYVYAINTYAKGLHYEVKEDR